LQPSVREIWEYDAPDTKFFVSSHTYVAVSDRGRVGAFVGEVVGFGVGAFVGEFVGFGVGAFVGEFVGEFVGFGVGELVGFGVGEFVGFGVGELVGAFVGLFVGADVIFNHNSCAATWCVAEPGRGS